MYWLFIASVNSVKYQGDHNLMVQMQMIELNDCGINEILL